MTRTAKLQDDDVDQIEQQLTTLDNQLENPWNVPDASEFLK